MKNILAAFAFTFAVSMAPEASACGTYMPEVQQRLDAKKHSRLRTLASRAAKDAELVLIGTVTDLSSPSRDAAGRVTLAVKETLKGDHLPSRTLAWDNVFVLSCDETDMFNNVVFRQGGEFIVYAKDDRVVRSDAADHLRDSSLLKLSEERRLVLGAHDD